MALHGLILDRAVGDSVNAVDARELHHALESGQDFSTWFKARVEQLGLREGVDFEKVNDSGSTESWNGMRTRIDYVVGLDAAKHIAMAERTETGHRVRDYFIAAEKQARAVVPAFDPTDPRVIVAVLEAQVEKVKRLEATVADQEETIALAAPKAEVHDRIMRSNGTFGFREAAKLVREATGATEGEFRSLLFKRQWVQRLDRKMAPKHYGREAGYVTSRMKEWTDAEGITHVKPELRITPKGVSRAIAILLQDEAA